ncbi:MAG: glycosyltransferase [Bacteroidales bacterium]|nr:glycosyltransferase [Bacteroidales bacterium]
MELGGAEMSLLGLLESLDYSRTEVDLFVYSHRGELMKWIPKQVNLLPEMSEYKQIERPIKDVLKDGCFRIALARMRAKRKFRRYLRKNHPKDGTAIFSYVARELSPILPDINPGKEYDIAVSYLMPHDYVLRKVRAREKVAWIHTDYSSIDVDAALELPVWAGYDRIASISPMVTDNFLKVFPPLGDKVFLKPNSVPVGLIRKRAMEIPEAEVSDEMPKVEGRINLLSVGRFSLAKNFDNVPDICRRLREGGVDVCWYLVGFGCEEALIRNKITESGMDGFVRILGKKTNPYPYIRACDLYVQPSRYEGDPVTVKEALALGKQVIVTDFASAADLPVSVRRVPMDNAGCAGQMINILKCF